MSSVPPIAQIVRPASSIYVVIALPSFALAVILSFIGDRTQIAAFLVVILALAASIARHHLMWTDDEVVYRRALTTVRIQRSVISRIVISSRRPLIPLFPLSSYLNVFTVVSDRPALSINVALFSPHDLIRFTGYIQHQKVTF